MKYKYYYCQLYHPHSRLVDVLEINKIPYQVTEDSVVPRLIKFSIWDTSDASAEIIKEIAELSSVKPIITVKYSSSEISSAEFLWITPLKQCVEILNVHEAYLSTCEKMDFMGMIRTKHRKQRSLFTVAKEPVMGKKYSFWAEDTGFSEIFTDYRVHELIDENKITGIELKNVMLKNGRCSDKLFQMTSQNLIDHRCIGTGHGEKIIHCEICGNEQFSINSAYQLHMDFSRIDKKSDMYVTERVFGEGISYPLYIISQRFYQLLKNAKLEAGITVSPVINTSPI